jgi:hypothetical protein
MHTIAEANHDLGSAPIKRDRSATLMLLGCSIVTDGMHVTQPIATLSGLGRIHGPANASNPQAPGIKFMA